MHWFHYFGIFLARALILLLSRCRVNGKENVPEKGPLLVVANHLNLADSPIVSASLGRDAVFMAKEELFHSAFPRYIVQNFGAFPVRRGGLDRTALTQAEQCLKKGLALVMFPEGKRSKTSRLQSAYLGSALIAARTGAPVLPVGITGTEKIKGSVWWLRRPKITVNIGRAFSLPGTGLTKAELTEQTAAIMEHIAALLPAQYGGKQAEEEKS